MSRPLLLRLTAIPILLEAFYSFGWAFILSVAPADEDGRRVVSGIGKAIYVGMLAFPGAALACSAITVLIFAGGKRVRMAVLACLAVQVLTALFGVLTANPILLAAGLVVAGCILAANSFGRASRLRRNPAPNGA